jgi:hypothetical protein
LLVVCAESLLGTLDRPPFANAAVMSWRYAAADAVREARRCDVLCFGDSQVQVQVLPRVLQESLGGKAFNLALPAGPPSASFFQLQKALRAGARPRAVVVDFTTHGLVLRAQNQLRAWNELVRWPDAAQIALDTHDLTFFSQLTLARLLPSYRMVLDIRSEVVAALGGRDTGGPGPAGFAAHLRNRKLNQGANVLPHNPDHRSLLEPCDDWLLAEAAQRDPTSEMYMRKFLNLARERQIMVFWLLPPVHPAALAERKRRGTEERYTAFVREVQRHYDNVVLLDARNAGLGRAAFCDLAHLSGRSAATLSKAIGSAMRDSLAAGPSAPHFVSLSIQPIEAQSAEPSRLALRSGESQSDSAGSR